MKTLNRKLTLDLFKHILFFLLIFYVFIVISDYSAHIQQFVKNRHIPLHEIALYYLCQLIKQVHILLPLSLLITSMKILTSMNRNFEIVALQAACISIQKIARPFVFAAFSCTLLLYLTSEFLAPKAEEKITSFQQEHLARNKKTRKKIQERDLIDGTKIIYQSYDPKAEEFFDFYWIKSMDEIWYAKNMQRNKHGTAVDHFLRNKNQKIEKQNSYNAYTLPISTLKIQKSLILENLPIRKLLKLPKDEKTLSQIWLKLLTPLLSLIIITAIIPSVTKFARDKHHLITFAIALFGFFAFFSIMNACAIIGESGSLPPYLALLPFPVLLETIFLIRWIKT